jgi:hypothetical protein
LWGRWQHGAGPVTDGGANVLQILQSATGAVNPSSVISGPSTQLQGAAGIVRDTAGNIYVANQTANSIVVYPPAIAGNVTPKFRITGTSTGLASPRGLAIDGQGRLVVANTAGRPERTATSRPRSRSPGRARCSRSRKTSSSAAAATSW